MSVAEWVAVAVLILAAGILAALASKYKSERDDLHETAYGEYGLERSWVNCEKAYNDAVRRANAERARADLLAQSVVFWCSRATEGRPEVLTAARKVDVIRRMMHRAAESKDPVSEPVWVSPAGWREYAEALDCLLGPVAR